jgi:hypothetical protein
MLHRVHILLTVFFPYSSDHTTKTGSPFFILIFFHLFFFPSVSFYPIDLTYLLSLTHTHTTYHYYFNPKNRFTFDPKTYSCTTLLCMLLHRSRAYSTKADFKSLKNVHFQNITQRSLDPVHVNCILLFIEKLPSLIYFPISAYYYFTC